MPPSAADAEAEASPLASGSPDSQAVAVSASAETSATVTGTGDVLRRPRLCPRAVNDGRMDRMVGNSPYCELHWNGTTHYWLAVGEFRWNGNGSDTAVRPGTRHPGCAGRARRHTSAPERTTNPVQERIFTLPVTR
ncbi:hypothetical protein GCM10022384_06280 [Streptomyces marokkonensis]|uniref:Uncharacterized protein n=1 Tax=Streptomyces marokkonensis TaxID=324855 RepID=A0ABP7NWX0_9ACTN